MAHLTASSIHPLPDGRRLRYAVVESTGTPRATIVIAAGRREFIEKKQSELEAELTQRGIRQIYFEWYGQGLSDRPFDGLRRQCDHASNFNQHLDDFRAFHRAIVQPIATEKLIVTGHSLGGHLMLRWLAEDRPANITAAIMTAPMMTIGSALNCKAAGLLSRIACSRGHNEKYAFFQHDYDDADKKFTLNPLSQDPERFALMEKYFAAFPDLTVGGVTWQWLREATRSIQTAQQPDYLKRIITPTLVLTGSHDVVTPPRTAAKYINTIPHVENLMIENARHDVMNELPTYRAETWRHIDRFLERTGIKVG